MPVMVTDVGVGMVGGPGGMTPVTEAKHGSGGSKLGGPGGWNLTVNEPVKASFEGPERLASNRTLTHGSGGWQRLNPSALTSAVA